MPLSLVVVTGSTRPGRVGPVIARWAEEAARAHQGAHGGFDVTLADLGDLGLPLLDEPAHPAKQEYQHEHTRRWSRIVDGADAFVMVTPEYDYFPPAALVNAVQALLREWAYKPAGVVSYGGASGGLRAAQGLRQLLGNVNVHALPQTVPVPMFRQFIGEDGALRPNEAMQKGMGEMLDELGKWAGALKVLRPSAA